MPLPYMPSSGEKPLDAGGDKWETILDFAPLSVIMLVNEGDEAGWYRLLDNHGTAGPAQRLIVGGGEPGQRRAAFNIPVNGLSGKLQIKADGIGARLTGIYATGMK